MQRIRLQSLADLDCCNHVLELSLTEDSSILGVAAEFWHRVLWHESVNVCRTHSTESVATYTGHELEHAALCLVKEGSDLVQALDQLFVLTD